MSQFRIIKLYNWHLLKLHVVIRKTNSSSLRLLNDIKFRANDYSENMPPVTV